MPEDKFPKKEVTPLYVVNTAISELIIIQDNANRIIEKAQNAGKMLQSLCDYIVKEDKNRSVVMGKEADKVLKKMEKTKE